MASRPAIEIAVRQKMLTDQDVKKVLELTALVWKMLMRLIASLKDRQLHFLLKATQQKPITEN